jgi:hypothetical protein
MEHGINMESMSIPCQILYGTNIDSMWNLHIIWNSDGMDMESTWNQHGMIWNGYGINMEWIWNIVEMHMYHL